MTALVSTLGGAAISFRDCCNPTWLLVTLGSGIGSLKVTVFLFFCFDTVVLLSMPSNVFNADISLCPLSFVLPRSAAERSPTALIT